MIRDYIIGGLVFVLIVFGISVSIKCDKLEKDNEHLKLEKLEIADSIKRENRILNIEIMNLFDEIDYCRHQIDSLKNVKNRVIVKSEYVVSEDLTEGVKLLKENLKCER